MSTTVYYGTLVHSVSLKEMEIVSNGVLIVNEAGVIVQVEKEIEDLEAFLATSDYKDSKVVFQFVVVNKLFTLLP